MSREITPEQLAELRQMRDDLRRGLDDFDRRFAKRQFMITVCLFVSIASQGAIGFLSLTQAQGSGPFTIPLIILSTLGMVSLAEAVYLGFPSQAVLDSKLRENLKNCLVQVDMDILTPSEKTPTLAELRADFPRIFELIEEQKLPVKRDREKGYSEQPVGSRK